MIQWKRSQPLFRDLYCFIYLLIFELIVSPVLVGFFFPLSALFSLDIYVCKCMYIYIHICLYMNTYIDIYIYIYRYIYMFGFVHFDLYMYIYTYIDIYIHI